MTVNYDAIIIGAGLSGAVIARTLANANKKVLIIERKGEIAGNMFDYKNEHNIVIHKYGPHIFHTSLENVYDFIMQYGEWIDYKVLCGAMINGKCTPTPFNFKTIDDFFDSINAEKIKNALTNNYPNKKTVSILSLLEHSDPYIKKFADFLWDNDYSLYTAKQWGLSPDIIDKKILKRVPVMLSYEEGYFQDKYQLLPKNSYVDFFKNVLNNSNIEIMLDTSALSLLSLDYSSNEILFKGEKFSGNVFWSGAIDELFAYKYGRLPYRSLTFELVTENRASYQYYPVVAQPQDPEITRITEYSKLPIQGNGQYTTYAKEYSHDLLESDDLEPYYPVLTDASKKMYSLYESESVKFKKLHVCGRLGRFKYFNMDQVINDSLECADLVLKDIQKNN